MKKVVTIHLAGQVFQIEEDAYYKLEEALCRVRLQNPAQCDALEASLAEHFQNLIELGQKIITFQMVYEILRDKKLLNIPPPVDQPIAGPKRIYRNSHNRVIAGVCSGIGEYLYMDPVLVRLIFVILFLGVGFGVLLYILMWILVPAKY